MSQAASMVVQPGAQRLMSLDAFRGLTMAAMLIVNNPGTWSHVYAPLRHAQWHGCTPTDLVFPYFLFAVGLAMAFSSRLQPGIANASGVLGATYVSILKRGFTLIAIGLGLNLVSTLLRSPIDLHTLRLPGVLQRIGLCYMLAAVVVLHLRLGAQIVLGAVILLAYWAMLTLVPVPGFADAATRLTQEGNLVAYVDKMILGVSHMYRWDTPAPHDPEGLLSTLPAIVTTLIGYWVGCWLKREPRAWQTSVGLVSGGAVLVGLGWIWHRWSGLPLNKELWSTSYVLFTGGCATITLGVLYQLCEVWGRSEGFVGRAARGVAWPLVVFGMNAILAFVGSGLLVRLLGLIKVASPNDAAGAKVALPRYLFITIRDAGLSPINASLAYAILTLSFWWVVLWVLYRKRWFWKI